MSTTFPCFAGREIFGRKKCAHDFATRAAGGAPNARFHPFNARPRDRAGAGTGGFYERREDLSAAA
jgi:hypothetical protein